MELVENYENLVKSMVPMEYMELVISGVWDTTTISRNRDKSAANPVIMAFQRFYRDSVTM